VAAHTTKARRPGKVTGDPGRRYIRPALKRLAPRGGPILTFNAKHTQVHCVDARNRKYRRDNRWEVVIMTYGRTYSLGEKIAAAVGCLLLGGFLFVIVGLYGRLPTDGMI
jgi:hypothetical protein